MIEPRIPIPLIDPIHDIDAVNRAIPGALLIADSDASFTIRQASQGYFDLIGFTREEVAEHFGNQGLQTLHPSDVDESLRSFLHQVQENPGHSFSIKARLVNKRKGYLWVQFSGRWMADEEQVCILLVDISEQEETLDKLKREQAFNALVSALSEDAFFDCDILGGTMRYSPNFAARFALSERIERYPQDLLERGVVAPDSHHFYEKRFLTVGDEIPEEELHLLTPDGEDVWYLCRYQIFRDSLGIPIRAVGKLSEVTKQKHRIEELSHKAQRDPLTGIFNKRTTELLIINRLEESASDERHALLLIDVDNFKEINDRLGHLYGDLVLTQLANGLKKLFRSEDVIGRIGGDEFFVFLSNCDKGPELELRAGQICETFRKTFQEKQDVVRISASVGIACWPQDGDNFYALYQNADSALYTAKQHGKDTFSFFDGRAQPIYENTRTEIDNRGRLQKNFESNLPEYVFKLLYEEQDVSRGIRLVLKLMGEHFGYSRAYIVEHSRNLQRSSNTFEWCAEGISSEMENLQNVPATMGKTIDASLRTHGHFVMHSLDDLPPNEERELVAAQGIRSMLHFAINDSGRTLGFIGFDDCYSERYPTPQDLDELGIICHVLGTFLVKQRSLEHARLQSLRLTSLLDQLRGAVSVVDPESHRILYENAAARRLGKVHDLGERCHEAYAGLREPCEACPLKLLSPEQPTVSGLVRHGRGDPRQATVTFLAWTEGKDACLVNLADVPDDS